MTEPTETLETTAAAPPPRRLLRWLLWRLTRIGMLLVLVLGAIIGVAWWVMIKDPGDPGGPRAEDAAGVPVRLGELEAQLRAHIQMLAGTIGARDHVMFPKQLVRAEAYVTSQLESMGYRVRKVGYPIRERTWNNVEATQLGNELPDEILVVGAHYDSVAESPGANDNASGVAAMLELARAWAGRTSRRTVRFVGFVNEEPPHHMKPTWGAWVYAKRCRAAGDQIVGMISLETLGYYLDSEGSQKYPPGLAAFYPSKGDFVAIVGNIDSRAFVHRVTRAFRKATAQLPCEAIASIEGIRGISWSDHAAFWNEGYPAVMLSDTAPFRYPSYHTPGDTPDKIDHARLARATFAAERVLVELADGD